MYISDRPINHLRQSSPARSAPRPEPAVESPLDSVTLSSTVTLKKGLGQKAATEFLFWTRKLALNVAAPVAGMLGVGLGLSPARLTGANELHKRGVDGSGVGVAIIDQGFTQFGAGSEDVVGVYETRSGTFKPGLEKSKADPVEELVTRNKGLSFHGNAMAGIITGESSGLTGVAPGAQVVGVTVVDGQKRLTPELFLKGLEWIADNHREQGVKVVSASVNYGSPTPEQRQEAGELVRRLQADGVSVVVAAGNKGPQPGTVAFPADVPGVIGAGAYTPGLLSSSWDDRLDRYSSRGGNGVPGPTLVAPGGDIFTKDNHGLVELTRGTSNSAPMIAGALALLTQAFPEASVEEKVAALTATAEPFHGSSEAEGFGGMRLEAAFDHLQSKDRPAHLQ